MFARNVHTIENQAALLEDPKAVAAVRENIKAGDLYVAKRVYPPDLVVRIKEYLTGIGRNSLPNYMPIEQGCPNFHRVNYWDERAYVKGCFHQFVFFPWNQDLFNLFELARPVYQLKNLLSGNPKDRFLGRVPDEGCVSRIAFQFYPSGTGGLHKHQDPVDFHQLSVPSLVMSKKGPDFKEGGLYVEKVGGVKICVEDLTDIGDVIYFNAQTPHGVDVIDPHTPPDWTSFRGRWMMLFAINKLGSNTSVANSVDLGK